MFWCDIVGLVIEYAVMVFCIYSRVWVLRVSLSAFASDCICVRLSAGLCVCVGSHVCVYVRVRVNIYTCENSGAEFMHVRVFSYACILTCVLMCVNAHICVNLHSCV